MLHLSDMGLRTAIIVLLVAIVTYFCLRPTDVILNSSVFIYRDPEYVYSKVSDMTINLKHHKYGQKAVLKKQFTREDGIKTEIYEVTERIPLGLFDWGYTLVFDTTMEHTRPGHQFNMHYSIWYAGLRGHITRTMTAKADKGGPGCLVQEDMVISTPWISSHYVLNHANYTHPDGLYHMKLTIESMHEYFNDHKQ